MIIVTRLNGETLGVNADLIERLEAHPDTVITLVDGKKVLVREGVEEIIEKVLTYRSTILKLAYDADRHGGDIPPQAPLRLVQPLHRADGVEDGEAH